MRWSRSKVIKSARLSSIEYFVPVATQERTPSGGQVAAAVRSTEADREQLQARQREQELAEAFAQGRQAGTREAEVASRETLGALTRALAEIDKKMGAFQERIEGRVAVLALAIVRKIMGSVSEDRAELIRQSIRKVLARHREPGDLLTIRVNPADLELLAPAQADAPQNLKFVVDAAIARGGCLLETKFGNVNAQVETQLEEIARALETHTGQTPGAAGAEGVVQDTAEVRDEGHVVNMVGMVIEARGPNVTVGDHCEVLSADRKTSTPAEVIGFRKNRVLLMPLAECHGVGPGHLVVARGGQFAAQVGEHLLGRVINGLGEPIDGLGAFPAGERVSIQAQPNNPMERRSISEPLYTGVRAIDGLITCGKGVRMGIFAGSGVGKSVLLGMMARNTSADVNVIALIGERGREVAEFLHRELGEEGLRRSVVVVATSDLASLIRIKASFMATTIAEYFRDRGMDVMLLMDSVTRLATAQREIGLAIGEPPTT
ncbi:MAG: hypothetical protein HGA76_08935, partial [Candidatus Firestonebacteria bacterium]|nr:hypothetical protein [Candidatus Firestonebacteria bacterium]